MLSKEKWRIVRARLRSARVLEVEAGHPGREGGRDEPDEIGGREDQAGVGQAAHRLGGECSGRRGCGLVSIRLVDGYERRREDFYWSAPGRYGANSIG